MLQRTLALMPLVCLAAPAFAQDSVEKAMTAFEDDLRMYRESRKSKSSSAARFADEAEAAAPAAAPVLWQQATSELRGLFDLTMQLRGSFLKLKTIVDAQPPFFYGDVREKLAKAEVLVDETVSFGVSAVVRMEMRAQQRIGDAAYVHQAQSFLDAHAHMLSPAAIATARRPIDAWYGAQRLEQERQRNYARDQWVAAQRAADGWRLDDLQVAQTSAQQSTYNAPPARQAAADRLVRGLRMRPLLWLDWGAEAGVGSGYGLTLGLHGRVGRLALAGGASGLRHDGAFVPSYDARLGLDLLSQPSWEWRRHALMPTALWDGVRGPGAGLEYSRYKRRYPGVRRTAYAMDVLPVDRAVRVRISWGRGGPIPWPD